MSRSFLLTAASLCLTMLAASIGCKPPTVAGEPEADSTQTVAKPAAESADPSDPLKPAKMDRDAEPIDFMGQIEEAKTIEDKNARVEALGKIAVEAARYRDQDATIAALTAIEEAGVRGSGRPEDFTPLEEWTRQAAMALARSKKDPNSGTRLVQQFASSDPLKFKQISDDVMGASTKIPGDVNNTIQNSLPNIPGIR